jgi:signal transduction histidine kinase
MKGAGSERNASRSGLVVGLLLLTLVLAGVLTWQAQVSTRYHRVTAEKVLRDYSMLAADEFVRRTVTELGYSGFFPVATALRQEAARGRLLSPADLKTSPEETVRAASDLVRTTFRYDPVSRALEFSGPVPDAATKEWIASRLAAAGPTGRDRRFSTEHAVVNGALRSIVYGTAGRTDPPPVAGFEVEPAAFAPRFRIAVAREPLLPPSLAHGSVGNERLFLRVLDPGRREIFRAGLRREPYLGVERPFGDEYNRILSGFAVQAALDPAAADRLVIGGLPKSRLPFLLGLLALTTGLTLTAVRQLRRERALSDLRSDFVSRVSHELRTPLTQIRMFAETLLLERVRSEEERRRSLEIIDRESRRLTNLVENVLRFSRSERGEDRVEAIERDAIPLVHQLISDFEPLLAGRAALSLALPDRALAFVDESAFRQILLNFLDNAAKYGPRGQEIRLSVAREDGAVSVSVEDRGPGIPAAEREKIWARFYRLERDRHSAVAGTGIGLAVVRDLARLQGGRAWAEERPGGGSRFVLQLRAAGPAAGETG